MVLAESFVHCIVVCLAKVHVLLESDVHAGSTEKSLLFLPLQGSRGGAVVRALASHQCGPGSILARNHMWVEFVVGSRPCSEGFSLGSPVFLPP